VNITSANTASNPATGTISASCAFAPGANVSVSYLGTTIGATADATTGILTLNYSATDPTLAINSGAFESTSYGVTTVTATGPNSAGGTNTATFSIDLVNPNATAGSGLAFTGADLAAIVLAALALIIMGGGVVLFTRRRAAGATK
jgi:hypothetical protein